MADREHIDYHCGGLIPKHIRIYEDGEVEYRMLNGNTKRHLDDASVRILFEEAKTAQATNKTIAGGCCIDENSMASGFIYQEKIIIGSDKMHEIIGNIKLF